MSVTNKNVVMSWSKGVKARNGRKSLWTDGKWLYSYRLAIGFRTTSGICVLGNYTSHGHYKSQTTSCHIGKARSYTNKELIWHPAVFEASKEFFERDAVPSDKEE